VTGLEGVGLAALRGEATEERQVSIKYSIAFVIPLTRLLQIAGTMDEIGMTGETTEDETIDATTTATAIATAGAMLPGETTTFLPVTKARSHAATTVDHRNQIVTKYLLTKDRALLVRPSLRPAWMIPSTPEKKARRWMLSATMMRR
jgi:hypothetical protein